MFTWGWYGNRESCPATDNIRSSMAPELLARAAARCFFKLGIAFDAAFITRHNGAIAVMHRQLVLMLLPLVDYDPAYPRGASVEPCAHSEHG